MTKYDWLLLFHIFGAFLLFSGSVVAGLLHLAAIRRERPSEIGLLLGLIRPAVLAIGVGALLTLGLGLWLVDDAGYGYGDGWIVASLVLWVAANALGAPRYDGPLQGGAGFHVSMPSEDGELLRWDVGLPYNKGQTDIRLRSVELVNPHGLEIAGIVLSYPVQEVNGVCLSAGNGRGFPPPGTRTDQISGIVLPRAATRTCENYPTIVVGLRRPSDASKGGVDAVRVRYEYDGTTYEVTLQSSVDLHRPQSESGG
jgi:hypothetical protein